MGCYGRRDNWSSISSRYRLSGSVRAFMGLYRGVFLSISGENPIEPLIWGEILFA